MKNPLYDLIVRNIQGAMDPQTRQLETQAVQTQSQTKAQLSMGLTPLVILVINLGSENIVSLQEEDETLSRALKAAEQKADPQFQIINKFLYRIKTNRRGQTKKHFAIPETLRQRVMTLAHVGVMIGHLSIHRTQEQIVTRFWWPGMSGDVTRFCLSCDVCQRTIRKGRPRRNINHRQQPDLNLRELSSESATVRPKLKLAPRTVKDPVNAVVHTEKNASIFGTGKPCGLSLVNETKRTLSQSKFGDQRSL